MSKMFRPAALLGLAALTTRAEAADLASEFVTVAGLAASTFPVDGRLAELLTADPLSLPPLEQTYEVVDFESYADPSTASLHLTTGAILLVDPSETGEFVRYRYRHPDGTWVRDAEGRFLTSSWYQTPDGRISKVIRNADGNGVGTYTVDPVLGGYELVLDLDADRVVDVQDIVTSDGHEQVSSTLLGRDWVALFLEGYNPMCYSEIDSGMSGMPDFGAHADDRASFGACNLSRGGRAGGFSGSLGQAPTGIDPLDALCASLSTPDAPAAEQEFRDRLAGSRKGDCVDDCMVDYGVCLGHCAVEGPLRSGGPLSPADAVCVVFCSVEAVICTDRCGAEVDEAGEIMVAPDPQPTIPESGGSGPYYDTDGDGRVDSEDVDDDGTPDLTCGSPGCGSEAFPPPYDGSVVGEGWDEFCRGTGDDKEREDRWQALEDAASDCPEPKEDPKAADGGGRDWFADCLSPPKDVDMDDLFQDAWGVSCAESPRGCEPKTLAEVRARFMAANDATVAFVLDCGDDLLCQPVPK